MDTWLLRLILPELAPDVHLEIKRQYPRFTNELRLARWPTRYRVNVEGFWGFLKIRLTCTKCTKYDPSEAVDPETRLV